MRALHSVKKGCKGVALLVTLVALVFLSIVASEIMYSTQVDLRISQNSRNRLQAWYLAQSAARLALLRLHIYQFAANQKRLSIPDNLLDQIWSTRFPEFPLAGSVYGEDHFLPGQLSLVIRPEGSKLPINLLDGNIHRGSDEEIAKQIEAELRELILAQKNDEAFEEEYGELDPEDLIFPLIDWIDKDFTKIEGGEENRDYDTREYSYEPRNDRIPVISELSMIHNWNDELINRFKNELSVLQTEITLNPNYVSLKRLKSFHPELDEEDLRAIAQRRREAPFADLDALASFIESSPEVRNGAGFTFPKVYTSSVREKVFVIEAVGIVGLSRREMKLGVRMTPEADQSNKGSTPPGGNPSQGQNNQTKNPSGSKKPAKSVKLEEPEVVNIEVVL